MFTVVFQTNDFVKQLIFPSSLTFSVQDFSFNVKGGPESCTIVAKSGDSEVLRDLLYHLRAPVDVYDEFGTWVWGGYLFESRVQIGGVTRTVSLENYYNAVRVAYTTSDGQTAYTDWTTDADGITNYGRKEMQETTSSKNPTAATNYATTLLATYSKIIPQVEVAAGENQATLTCKGWFSTLEWRYYSTAALGLSYWPSPMVNESWNFGMLADNSVAVAQSLTTNGAYAFDSVVVWLAAFGGFPDALTAALYEQDGSPGQPNTGTLRASVTKQVADMTAYADNAFYFDTLYEWAASHSFYLVFTFAGLSPSLSGYIRKDSASTGALVYQTNWGLPVPDFGLVYNLHGVLPNETRIANAITSHATFFTGTDTVATSMNTDTHCDGGSTLKAVLDSLLEMGTSAGVRLLASVTEGRRLRLSAEATGDASSATLMLTKDGKIRNILGGSVGAQNICGQYAVFWDEIPAILTGVTRELDLSYFYIESADYNVADDSWTPTARGAIKPFDIFGLSKK